MLLIPLCEPLVVEYIVSSVPPLPVHVAGVVVLVDFGIWPPWQLLSC